MAVKYLSFPALSEQIKSNFWSKVAITANNDKCWLWQAGLKEKGYGTFNIKYKMFRAHRVSFYISFGVDPEDLDVLHKCDNPQCVNPKHLFLGTNAENMIDKIEKGRQPRGIQHGHAKLSENDVREIRTLYASGNISQQKLADKFGVHRGSILQVLRGTAWKHIQ